jgi:hypothetical protein
MTAADFCLITPHVAMQGAAIGPHVRQISPDKDVNCHPQPQHLPYFLNPGLRHVVLTHPETGPYMLFLSVGSWFCTPASFGRSLAVPPLPSANTFVNDINH